MSVPFDCWDQMRFWTSGEWQVIEEYFDAMDKAGVLYNPRRELMFAALDATPFKKVKVALYGQDPYPDRNMASGLAFSIPNGSIREGMATPPTLVNLLSEYSSDLHYPIPKRTSLESWANHGVLLWNVIPSCRTGASLSQEWPEWAELTTEITRRLSDEKDIVFILLGQRAQKFRSFIDEHHNTVIVASHPSPRGARTGNNPFFGSRILTRANAALVSVHKKEAVDWKLI